MEHIYLEDTRKKTLASFCYEIHLRPTVILHNSLPVPLYILTCGAIKELIVPAGASRYLSSVEPGAAYVVLKVKKKKVYINLLRFLTVFPIINWKSKEKQE